jgi:transcriptional regulator of acetoin/glycerol metabolism
VVRHALVTRNRGDPLRLSDLPPELWHQIANLTGGRKVRSDAIEPPPEAVNEPKQSSRSFDVMSILAASSWKLGGALDLCEQQILTAALDVSSGNRSRAARLLGISARSIFNKMRKHRLTP